MLCAVSREELKNLIKLGEAHARITLELWQSKVLDVTPEQQSALGLSHLEALGKIPSWYDLLEAVAALKRMAQIEVHALLCLGTEWDDKWSDAIKRVQSTSYEKSTIEIAGFTDFAIRLASGLAKFDKEMVIAED